MTHPVFHRFQVAQAGHSPSTTLPAGLIRGRMHRHARQPHAAPAWPEAAATARTGLTQPEPHEGPEEVPTKSWVVLQLQQALFYLLLPETPLQL